LINILLAFSAVKYVDGVYPSTYRLRGVASILVTLGS